MDAPPGNIRNSAGFYSWNTTYCWGWGWTYNTIDATLLVVDHSFAVPCGLDRVVMRSHHEVYNGGWRGGTINPAGTHDYVC